MAKLAIFDIDGTLVNSNKVDSICFARSIREEFDLPEIDERWEMYEHATDAGIFEEAFERAFSRKPLEEEVERNIARFLNLLHQYYAEDRSLYDEIGGASALLQRLRNDPEWNVGIATGAWKESALFKLESAGIFYRDTPLVTSSELHTREEILQKCTSDCEAHYGVAAFEKIVSIGDAIWDLKTAANLNIGFIAINEPEKFADFPDCTVLRNFSEQERFMKCLEEARIPVLRGQ